MNLDPIGTVQAPVTAQVDENWGNVVLEIHLNNALAAGLLGIETFSHALIIFFMHEAGFTPATDLVRRPRGRANLPEAGIFAQRAKHRPNPIGLTAVRILGHEGNILRVQGLDAIDGTPVLDIKPYVPFFDQRRTRDDATLGRRNHEGLLLARILAPANAQRLHPNPPRPLCERRWPKAGGEGPRRTKRSGWHPPSAPTICNPKPTT